MATPTLSPRTGHPVNDPETLCGWLDRLYQRVVGASSSALNDQITIQDQQTNTTTGTAYTTGAWRTVTLQTTVTDTGSNVVSLASNAFALKAGSYEFVAFMNAGHVGSSGFARMRLRNTSDSSTVIQGPNASEITTDIELSITGNFTIAAQKTFELQVWVAATTTAGFAVSTGEVEVYASIRLRKYA